MCLLPASVSTKPTPPHLILPRGHELGGEIRLVNLSSGSFHSHFASSTSCTAQTVWSVLYFPAVGEERSNEQLLPLSRVYTFEATEERGWVEKLSSKETPIEAYRPSRRSLSQDRSAKHGRQGRRPSRLIEWIGACRSIGFLAPIAANCRRSRQRGSSLLARHRGVCISSAPFFPLMNVMAASENGRSSRGPIQNMGALINQCRCRDMGFLMRPEYEIRKTEKKKKKALI